MKYSKSTGGFYDVAVHGASIPNDAVVVSVADYAALLTAQSAGATIQADASGHPIAVFCSAPTLEQIISNLTNRIDQAADAARLAIAGDPLRVVEYQRAEAEAETFAAAEYAGTVPLSVASWAEAKGWTAQEAADDILRASAAWNAALYAFRDIRLKGKETVKAAADAIAAQTAADAVFAQIKAILAQVQ